MLYPLNRCTKTAGLLLAAFLATSAVVRQILGAKAPAQGFYRIVFDGQQARQAVAQGKLAVMLGVEVDTPRGCRSDVDCSAQAASIVQRYYDLGVRSVFPVHVIDNAFGGTALYSSLFEFNNYFINSQH